MKKYLILTLVFLVIVRITPLTFAVKHSGKRGAYQADARNTASMLINSIKNGFLEFNIENLQKIIRLNQQIDKNPNFIEAYKELIPFNQQIKATIAARENHFSQTGTAPVALSEHLQILLDSIIPNLDAENYAVALANVEEANTAHFALVLTLPPPPPALLESNIHLDPYALHDAAREGDLAKVQEIANQVTDINAKNNDEKGNSNETALHIAAQEGHFEIVEFLVDTKKAIIDIKNDSGRTPLHLAIRYAAKNDNKNLKTINFLLEKGADINAITDSGFTALQLAAVGGNLEIFKSLTEKLTSQDPALDITTIRNKHRKTLLHLAAMYGNGELVEHMVKQGFDITAKDEVGDTPETLANKKGHEAIAVYLNQHSTELKNLSNEERNVQKYHLNIIKTGKGEIKISSITTATKFNQLIDDLDYSVGRTNGEDINIFAIKVTDYFIENPNSSAELMQYAELYMDKLIPAIEILLEDISWANLFRNYIKAESSAKLKNLFRNYTDQ